MQHLVIGEKVTKIYKGLEYISIERNEKADNATKKRAGISDTRQCTKRFTLLAHINHTINERKRKKTKH